MRTKKKQKKIKIEPGDRLIFQLPDEMIPDFNDLKSVGFGDTEIVVACLKDALASVKADLLQRRAREATDLYAKQANYVKIPSRPSDPNSMQDSSPHGRRHAGQKRGTLPEKSGQNKG